MTTPSLHQLTGLTLSAFKPIIDATAEPCGYIPDGEFLANFTGEVNSWQHVTNAFGGYDNAKFTIAGRQTIIEDWMEYGLGRHIVCYNPAMEIIWEGFVNKMAANLARLAATSGPLLDIANRVALTYSTIDALATPPILGERVTTAATTNTDSQAAYGVLEKVLSSGGVQATEATTIRNTFLAENAWPATSQREVPTGMSPSVTIECLGYVHWLKAYVYNSASTGLGNLSTKLQNILSAELNTIYNGNYDIASNTLQVPRYENKNRVAWGLIKGLVARGDASAIRYLFGVWANRRVVYQKIPDYVEYQQRLGDKSQRVETLIGGEIKPWDVLPGKWLMFPDFLPGLGQQPQVLRQDPRCMFIEKVTFTAPWRLALQGGKTDTIPQLLGRMGLAGVGA